MKIIVCPLSKVQSNVALHAPERVVSLLDPGFAFPELGEQYRDRHLRLHLHDVHDSTAGQVAATNEDIEQLLAFILGWNRSAPMLIHCRAGIGRSSAAGFIAACLHTPRVAEIDIARALRKTSALARPNELLVQLADTAMSRGGRMLNAIRDTGRDLQWQSVDENEPFELSIDSVAYVNR